MALKMIPEQLRQQAQKLMDQAAEEEARRENQIGKIIVDFIKKDFIDFDLDLFMDQAREIWNTGKLTKKSKRNASKPALVAGSNV